MLSVYCTLGRKSKAYILSLLCISENTVGHVVCFQCTLGRKSVVYIPSLLCVCTCNIAMKERKAYTLSAQCGGY